MVRWQGTDHNDLFGAAIERQVHYRGTSLIRNRHPLRIVIGP